MNKPDHIIAEKSVSALVDNAEWARLSKMILGLDGRISTSLSKKMIGGQWISGKAFVTKEAFEFHPSLLNKPFIKNMDDLCLRLPWSDITSVSKRFGMVSPIIDLATPQQTCSIRCQSADQLMTTINNARLG